MTCICPHFNTCLYILEGNTFLKTIFELHPQNRKTFKIFNFYRVYFKLPF